MKIEGNKMKIENLNDVFAKLYDNTLSLQELADFACEKYALNKAPQHECCGGTGACAKKSDSFIKKTDTEIKLVIPAPGLSKKDLSVTVERGNEKDLLLVKGSVSIPDYDFKSDFNKQVSIPKDVDLAAVTVEVVDGLIKIKLPRVVKTPDVVEIKIS